MKRPLEILEDALERLSYELDNYSELYSEEYLELANQERTDLKKAIDILNGSNGLLERVTNE